MDWLNTVFDSKAMVATVHKLFLAYALNFVFAIIIFLIGWWVAKMLRRFLRFVLQKNHVEETIASFACRIVYIATMVVVLIAALSRLGVQTGSLVAVLGAASLAVGLSLKNYLANFASGILLISSRLFKAGDYVEVDGKTGTVKKVQIFFTTLYTPDNQVITIPNSSIVSKNVTHYCKLPTRRVNVNIGIGYDDDIDHARDVLMQEMANESRVLTDPAPIVLVTELGDSSVNLLARCWVNRPDYFSVLCTLNENMKKACDRANINIPYPQTDVHLIQDKS